MCVTGVQRCWAVTLRVHLLHVTYQLTLICICFGKGTGIPGQGHWKRGIIVTDGGWDWWQPNYFVDLSHFKVWSHTKYLGPCCQQCLNWVLYQNLLISAFPLVLDYFRISLLCRSFSSFEIPHSQNIKYFSVRQSQTIPAGFAASQKKNQVEYFGCFSLISSHLDNPPLSGCLFYFHTTVHLSRILGNMETLGGVKMGCAEMWALSFVLPKG